MKKLFLLTLIACIYMVNIYCADDQNPGFRIEGLDALMADASAKVIADAADQLKQSTIPALEQAVKNNVHELKSALTEVINEAQPKFKATVKEGLAEAGSSILLSTAGLMITSAGIMLMYQGLKADSKQQNDDSSKKVNTTKLLGYGGGLIVIGLATIMHTSIKNAFNSAKA